MTDLKHSLLSLGVEEQLSHRQARANKEIDKRVFETILHINSVGNRSAFEDEIAKVTGYSIEAVNQSVARLQREQSINRGTNFDNIKGKH